MGTRGPAPKRSEERRRQNKPDVPTAKVSVSGPVTIPSADPKWHKLAKRLYQSLRLSGQARFYEPSDWAAAYVVCENLSRDLGGDEPINAASLASYLKAFGSLGVTEGDRRRIGIEVTRKQPGAAKKKPAAVVAMDDYRKTLGG